MVSIRGYTLTNNEPMVDMASLDDLFEVARKYETVVMEHTTGEETAYYVWDDGLMYRFRDSGTVPTED